jgi:hypothetical protein
MNFGKNKLCRSYHINTLHALHFPKMKKKNLSLAVAGVMHTGNSAKETSDEETINLFVFGQRRQEPCLPSIFFVKHCSTTVPHNE